MTGSRPPPAEGFQEVPRAAAPVLDCCLWIFAFLQVPQNFRHWENLRKGEAPHLQPHLKREVLRVGGGKKGEGLGKGVPRDG